MKTAEICGYLNIYKEKGLTSHDVVFKARKILGTKKIGHTGTLDPNAQGVLVLCIGKATKMVQYLEILSKTYQAEIIFGIETDTCDITGSIVSEKPSTVSEEEFHRVLEAFKGDTMQVPPIYSALKINGKKLYHYARNGETVDIPPRPIQISRIEATATEKLPQRAQFIVECSKGTYIRSLCRDLGQKMGTVACMGDLWRLRVGDFHKQDSLTLAELEKVVAEGHLDSVLHRPEEALTHYAEVHANDRGSHFLRNGNHLYTWSVEDSFESYTEGQLLRLYDKQGFAGIGRFCSGEEDAYVKPLKLF